MEIKTDTGVVPGRSHNQLLQTEAYVSEILFSHPPRLLRTCEIIEDFLKNPNISEINKLIIAEGTAELPQNTDLRFYGQHPEIEQEKEFCITFFLAASIQEWNGARLTNQIKDLMPPSKDKKGRAAFFNDLKQKIKVMEVQMGISFENAYDQIDFLSREYNKRNWLATRSLAAHQEVAALVYICLTIRFFLVSIVNNKATLLPWPHIYAVVAALLNRCKPGPTSGIFFTDEAIRDRLRRGAKRGNSDHDRMMKILADRHFRCSNVSPDSLHQVCASIFSRTHGNT